MFENLNAWEFGGLLLVALLIFGDKLPKVIGDGMRLLRNLRQMATNATGDLSRELGTDISIDDLNPKNFVRKHLLDDLNEDTAAAAGSAYSPSPYASSVETLTPGERPPYDTDAT